MSKARVNFIQAHEIGVVGRRQEKFSTRPRDAVHFADGGEDLREMLDGFAGNHEVEGSVGERQALRVPLYKRGERRLAVAVEYLGRGGVQSGGRKIAADDAGACPRQFANEAAPPAGYFKNAQARD